MKPLHALTSVRRSQSEPRCAPLASATPRANPPRERVPGRGWTRYLAALGVALSACLGGGGGGGSSCDEGSEGCQCFPNDTCLDGLSCRSDLCVDLDASKDDDAGTSRDDDDSADDDGADDDSADDDGADDDGADDDGADDDSADDDSADDASDDTSADDGSADDASDDASADDGSADDASDDASADDDASDDASADDGSSDDTSADDDASDDASADDGSSDDTGLDDTSVDDSALDDTGLDDTSVDDSTLDDTSLDDTSIDDGTVAECSMGTGSCATGDGVDCENGQLVVRDCTACALLSCGIGCCGSVWPLAAETYPYVRRDDLITGFSVSSSAAQVSASFDAASEFVGVGFTLDPARAIDPVYLYISSSTTGSVTEQVSLERDETTGCLYETLGGYPSSLITCWGDWELTGIPTDVSTVLVRIESTVSQSASLSVLGVSF